MEYNKLVELRNQIEKLSSQGRPIPHNLTQELENETKKEANEDVFNKGINKRNANASNKINNPFSHGYANSIGHQPKARASARIGMGGLF